MGDHIIRMSDVFCNQSSHSHELIKTLCLNPQCQQNSTLCSICLINTHLVCRSQVLQLKEIPQQLNELQQLKLAIEALQNKVNHEFKNLLDKIEQSLQPISKYQDCPNFTNLNEIGLLLRKNPKQNIPNTINQTMVKIRLLLDNYDCQLGIAQQFIKYESFQSPNTQKICQQSQSQKSQNQKLPYVLTQKIVQYWLDAAYDQRLNLNTIYNNIPKPLWQDILQILNQNYVNGLSATEIPKIISSIEQYLKNNKLIIGPEKTKDRLNRLEEFNKQLQKQIQ